MTATVIKTVGPPAVVFCLLLPAFYLLCASVSLWLNYEGTILIEIKEEHLIEIRRHGECDYPYECCGLLIGRFEDGRKVVVETYPISNAREEEAKRNRFLIRPDELMRGEKHAQARALDVVGFYHSHPDDQPVPSQYDLEHAWPTYSYIVVAVAKGRADDLRSWEMEPDRTRFSEEPISMTSVSEARP